MAMKFWLSIGIGEKTIKFTILLLTRFNKIAIQGKGSNDKWTRKPLAYREFLIFVICPPEICVNIVIKHCCIHCPL